MDEDVNRTKTSPNDNNITIDTKNQFANETNSLPDENACSPKLTSFSDALNSRTNIDETEMRDVDLYEEIGSRNILEGKTITISQISKILSEDEASHSSNDHELSTLKGTTGKTEEIELNESVQYNKLIY